MARQIFISYRRDDEPGMATALYYHLERRFSADSLFMDVEGGIPPGHDFVRVLEQQVVQCDIMLAMVGRNWLTATDSLSRRRLDNPDDFVRIEIESALRLGKLVIPVLINRTEMPHASELPDSLKPFAHRHAVRLTHERFRSDAQGLETVVEQALFEAKLAKIAAANEIHRNEEEAAQRRRQDLESQRQVEEASIRRRDTMEAEADEDQHQVPAIDAKSETSDRRRFFELPSDAQGVATAPNHPPDSSIRSESKIAADLSHKLVRGGRAQGDEEAIDLTKASVDEASPSAGQSKTPSSRRPPLHRVAIVTAKTSRWYLSAGIAMIVALAAALVGPVFIDWSRYRAEIEVQAGEMFGVPVRAAGTIDVRLLPTPSLKLNDVEIGPAASVQTVTARALAMEFSLGTLMRREFRANQVTLDRPEMRVGLDQSGAVQIPGLNFRFDPDRLAIERLTINEGRLVLADLASGGQLAVEQLNLTGDVGSAVGPFEVEGTFTAKGEHFAYRFSGGRRGEDGSMKVRLGVDPVERALAFESDGTVFIENGALRFEGAATLSRVVGIALPGGRVAINDPWKASGKIKATSKTMLVDQLELLYGRSRASFG